jgi:polysaccharide biosynthesis transport protein
MNTIFIPQRGMHDSAAAGAATAEEGRPRASNPILLRYFDLLVRRKWILAGTVAACLLTGLLVTLLMTPLYTASSTLEISRESDRVVDIKGVQAESSPGELEFYQTQYGLLRARSLAERVARDLKLTDDPAFYATFGKSYGDGLFEANSQRALQSVSREERMRDAVEILLKNITISPVRLSRLVDVSFTSPDPSLSAKIANGWTEHFIESNLERRFDATAYARRFLEQRLEQLRVKLEESERNLVGYAANQQIINVPSARSGPGADTQERSIVAEDLSALNASLAAATADAIRARSRAASAGGATAESVTNDTISNLREKRAELAAEYSRLLTQFEPSYPPAAAMATQIRDLDRSIAREEGRVRSSILMESAAADARRAALAARVNALKSDVLDLRRRSIQYNIFQREVDTNRQLYDGLLQRYKEIGIAGGVGTNNVAVVDPAEVPTRPSRPRLGLNLVLSLLVGVGLGIALAFAMEQVDQKITNPGMVLSRLNVPLLGTIPKADNTDPAEALRDRKSSIVEAYLSVQTNLSFATNHGFPRSVSVTSTRPGEGKSTSAFAIAQSLARSGKKVILIDADMRSPSVHHLLGWSNGEGLSNYLAGSDDVPSLMRNADDLGIAIMTAGPQPPNAAELLSGTRFTQLLAALKDRFDHVVVDSPPVMGLADAPLIASFAEGAIFVIESSATGLNQAQVALDRLRSARVHVLGVILTKYHAAKAHLGYGYDYGYAYGSTRAA